MAAAPKNRYLDTRFMKAFQVPGERDEKPDITYEAL